MASQLPFWQKSTGPRVAPLAAQCACYYGLDVWISQMICPLGYIRQRKVNLFILLVIRLQSYFGRLSNQWGQTQPQRNSSNIPLIPWEYGPAFCTTKQESYPITSSRGFAGLVVLSGCTWRDTSAIQFQHVNALREASQEAVDLVSALPTDVIVLSNSMTDGTNNLGHAQVRGWNGLICY